MLASNRALKVFMYYAKEDLSVVRALYERLELDGVDVVLPEIGILEIDSDEAEDSLRLQERKTSVKEAVEEADIILFCLSKEFNRLSSVNTESRFVLDTAVKKQQGNISILPVRLEACSVPPSLKRWLAVDLHSMDGYEKLMLAMKLRADKVNAGLTPDESWHKSFYETTPTLENAGWGGKLSMLMIIPLLILAGVAALLFIRVADKASANETQAPADILAENATQNILSIATSRAGTATSASFLISDPLTQTAVYRTTTEPLALTATAMEARITPTITLTSVALPTQIIVSDNISMMLVPGGRFVIGYDGDPDAEPANQTFLDLYYIDQFEVTNAQYQMCVSADVCQLPNGTGSQTRPEYYGTAEFADFPVINVDWYMARTFCEWRGVRLPTEAEWETAARGFESLTQPWGAGTGCIYANYDNCIGDTQSVDKYLISKSEFDVYNMAGNVAEWVGSLYFPYPYSPFDERDNPALSGSRVVRGGSWASPLEEIFTYHRIGLDPASDSVYGNDLGFRCARDANQ